MDVKKHIKRRVIAVFIILLVSIILTSYVRDFMEARKSVNNFSQLIENGEINALSLTIYYMDPSFLTPLPVSVDMLIKGYADDVIYISNLEEHIDLLNQLRKVALIPVMHKSRMDARFYYVFETEEEGKILDVAMWGDNYSIYVNGLEVKSNDIFYDIIMPFLPDDLAINLEANKNDANAGKL